ncbi:efflux RND transporter permease subunit [Parendozoicomonas sp. Alg238-R29]|uniref:efflux RND transporter permease subunit n=1 Tax=Parendozoicomonas sp. Alg238-R29 TaxID=2993446 RepID=UPI00248DFF3F|nr:efflux RND transporter permease subunit [Parendozoicomonas sp. Alg238-R29]
MVNLIRASLDHSRTILMVLLLLLVSGTATYLSIPKESSPDITIPVIYVSMSHEGISPEDAESLLVRPMENELQGIDGLKELSSTSSQGHGSVVMEFVAGVDPDKALSDVRDKVDQAKAKLPDNTDEPVVNQVTLAQEEPVINVILSGDVSQVALIKVGRDLQERLEALKEVLEVDIGGDREDVAEIIIDPLRMETYGLNQNDIFNLVSRNNQLVAAGRLDTGKGRFPIKLPSVYKTPADILSQPIKVNGDRVVTFADIADVRVTYKDPDSYARLNGRPSIALEIKKRPGENIFETIAEVKAMVEQLRPFWPSNLQVDYVGDTSIEVQNMLNDLQNNVLTAVLLVVIVVVGALGLRSAGLVGMAIPTSFVTGILVLGVLGYTVNMVVLFSLIMAVGMLVDGAIVVTEYADRKMIEGQHRKQAYREAAQRMAWPITASTATTLAAFAPLLFWPGIAGEFMSYLPLTMIATLTASLVTALIFIPTLGSLFGKPRLLTPEQTQVYEQAETGDILTIKGLSGSYVRFLAKAVRHPWLVLGSTLVIVVTIFSTFATHGPGVEFFPETDNKNIIVNLRARGADLSIEEKNALVLRAEALLEDFNEIDTVYSRAGGSTKVGTLRITLFEWQYRHHSDYGSAEIRRRLETIPGLEVEVQVMKGGPQNGKPLQLEVVSSDFDKLQSVVAEIKTRLASHGGFTNISDNGPTPGLEWQLDVDRTKAARFGADVAVVGSTVQLVTNGLRLGDYRPDDVDEEVEIRARYPKDQRHIEQLDSLRVMTANGLVPVSSFVTRTVQPRVGNIQRVDGRRAITVDADLKEGVQLARELPVLAEMLKELDLEPDIGFTFKGEQEDQQESGKFLVNAFMVALFVMAIILVTQFNSYYQMSLILSAVVLSTGGVLLSLLISGQPFGIVMSGVGIISLAGIVVNNNIVLIDTYNIFRRKGLDATEAILRTGAQRLRPVLLTTITTILGLIPMVMNANIYLFDGRIEIGAPSTAYWNQLATALAGGLAFATVLTLVLTPCLLVMRSQSALSNQSTSAAYSH